MISDSRAVIWPCGCFFDVSPIAAYYVIIAFTAIIMKGVVDLNNEETSIISRIAELILGNPPAAIANIQGSEQYPDIEGTVVFYPEPQGVMVLTAITGLPVPDAECGNTIHGMHIHEGGECSGTEEDPFANAGTHYNPYDCPHPQHAGDLPPIFADNGSAWNAVLMERFSVEEIIGKTVIIHDSYDDFHTQPAGDSGAKIACGVISSV